MEKILKSWAVLASHFIGEHFDHCKPYMDVAYDGMHPLTRFVSTQLYISCQLSSTSALVLIKEGLEWDAEIINRSIIEGVTKYVYLLTGSAEERLEKTKEYWELLPDYAATKRSAKVKRFFEEVSEAKQNLPLNDLLLSDREIDELRNGTNKNERSNLEQKWSFSHIINEFSKSDSPGLRAFISLAHGYGMSSHLIHKDGDGVGMIWERCSRPEERQSAVKLGHCARTVSDVCSFAKLRTIFLLKACNEDPIPICRSIGEHYSVFFNDLEEAYKSFESVEY
ncbi:DUF5677 domain-containing protein [Alteromonas marina]